MNRRLGRPPGPSMKGWDCPSCGGKNTIERTKNTRWADEGINRRKERRRECVVCGERFSTVEILKEALPDPGRRTAVLEKKLFILAALEDLKKKVESMGTGD